MHCTGSGRRLHVSGAQIEAVAMDMSQAYASTVARHLPHALIEFGRFHMMKLMNEKLDELRRQMVRETPTEDSGHQEMRWLRIDGTTCRRTRRASCRRSWSRTN